MSKRSCDFRSDTVTLPTEEMRKAMMNAEVGDDVYEEDPTLKKLEQKAAAIAGKEKALFVTSGTQGNLLAVLSQTRPGEEIILEADSHIYYYEVGGISTVAGVLPSLIHGKQGVISPEMLEEKLRPSNIHFPDTSLLCIENTHNRAGGTVWQTQDIEKVSQKAHDHGLKVHMDGARVFNAAAATGCNTADLTKYVDSVMFCLSKGLGAPVGSIIAGDSEFIARARKWRKMLGGGVRQAGIIAAAGLIALETMVERLKEDHTLAYELAQKLQEISYLQVDLETVNTNIVIAHVDEQWGNAEMLLAKLEERGLLAVSFGPQTVRFMTHKDVDLNDVKVLIQVLREL